MIPSEKTSRIPGSAPSQALPNIPWEDRKVGSSAVLWRSSRNPIVRRDQIARSNSIFNSAVVPFGDEFAGVFRVDDTARLMTLHSARSRDGVDWDIEPEPIAWQASDSRSVEVRDHFEYGYDPRVTWIEDRYYVSWCNGYFGPTIGLGWTDDFRTFHQLENALLPFNRNGVLFPRRIRGEYLMLSRPSDNGHTPFGDMFLSTSPDLTYWGRHRHVMAPKGWTWEATKIGAGHTPIETAEGWLMIYHGVLTYCNGFVYSMGAELLDLDEPWKVIARSRDYLLSPQMLYEQVGDTPNVVFPCAALLDRPTGRLTVYYGGADTVVCLAHGYIDEILDFVKARG